MSEIENLQALRSLRGTCTAYKDVCEAMAECCIMLSEARSYAKHVDVLAKAEQLMDIFDLLLDAAEDSMKWASLGRNQDEYKETECYKFLAKADELAERFSNE